MARTRKTYALCCVKAIPPLIDQIWSEGDRVKFSPFMATIEAAEFINKTSANFGNRPNDDLQRALQAELLSAIANLSKARLSLFTQSNDAIPAPFLVILILWLAVIFASFGTVCPTQSDRDRDVFHWRTIGSQCNFSDPGNGSAFCRLDADF